MAPAMGNVARSGVSMARGERFLTTPPGGYTLQRWLPDTRKTDADESSQLL